MYLPNKYSNWYSNIIETARSRPSIEGYFEKHHIIPKSMGGSNTKENLVKLTPREHFICHWLLTKMVSGSDTIKMKRALWRMLVKGTDFQQRYLPNSYTYEALRIKHGYLRKGHITPDNVKQKISNANKGKAPWNKGLARTTQEKQNISNSRKGSIPWNLNKLHSIETKAKISAAAKNREKVMCEHCNKITTRSNHTRWHGNNCKLALGELKFQD